MLWVRTRKPLYVVVTPRETNHYPKLILGKPPTTKGLSYPKPLHIVSISRNTTTYSKSQIYLLSKLAETKVLVKGFVNVQEFLEGIDTSIVYQYVRPTPAQLLP